MASVARVKVFEGMHPTSAQVPPTTPVPDQGNARALLGTGDRG
jgi:hypothetical protein